MSFFSWPSRDDAIFLLLMGCTAFWTGYRISRTLDEFREVTRITKEDKPADFFGQQTEDAISLDTLGELHGSPNWNIRQASTKILIERALRPENLEPLLRNAVSKDRHIQEEAMTVLAYLSPHFSHRFLREHRIYNIVVDALVAYLPDSAKRSHEPHTDWKQRSKTEIEALFILRHIMSSRTSSYTRKWLLAGLVTRWLAHYPFGGIKAKHLNKKEKAQLRASLIDTICAFETDDIGMEFIFQMLANNRTAVMQLRRFDLLGAADSGQENRLPTRLDGMSFLGRSVQVAETEESWRARRRRRREAVVVGDAGQPISQDNIFNVDAQDMEIDSTTW